jgi:hypothetical protein
MNLRESSPIPTLPLFYWQSPLVKEAFNINKDLHDNVMYSWYTFATKIFEEFNFDFTEYENFNKPFYKIKNNLTKKTFSY